MRALTALAAPFLGLASLCEAEQWPYNRYHAGVSSQGTYVADKTLPESDGKDAGNQFTKWFQRITDRVDNIQDSFLGSTVPPDSDFGLLFNSLNLTNKQPSPLSSNLSSSVSAAEEAEYLFRGLGFPLEPSCIESKENWWYRTADGSCNWLKKGEASQGSYGQAKSRDYDQHCYADGIAKPREGPNPRAVSNAFFKRKETIYYEHTPLLLGLIEFVLHDVTYSQDSATEYIDVPVPEDETEFPPNTTLRVWRTEAVEGTGTSPDNPRENVNKATTWIDLSSLYGSTRDVADALRTFAGGRLRTQEVPAPNNRTPKSTSYLPFNTFGIQTRKPHGMNDSMLFAGGDPRTNEDWVMLAVHSLMLREHNRMAGILATQRPEMDDEQLYQTTRLLMSAKFQLIAKSYQMAYFKDMDWPQDDGFPLFRTMMGKDWLQINPANAYPWPMAMKHGRPTVVSAEMAVVYRFHEFIIEHFPVVDAAGNTLWNQSLFDTGFDAPGFIDAGLENILRGVVSTTIPNFKSGVDEAFRTAGKYRGRPFDIVTWSIVHEREQGLPTFNAYFREYNKQEPDVLVPIRETFEAFTTDPAYLEQLRRLYPTPDDVDLVVGCQLDETLFPKTTVPTSALIVSLFNLISMGNADRFSVGYAAMRCWLVDKPWDCHPSNALEDLLWKPVQHDALPHFRFYDEFWMTELDFQAHGQNLLWRLVTENTDIQCLQRHPLFPADPKTNPILCVAPSTDGVDWPVVLSSAIEVTLTLAKQHAVQILATIAAVLLAVHAVRQHKARAEGLPPVMKGWPVLGEGVAFQQDAKLLLQRGLAQHSAWSPSRVFGMRLGPKTHYLLTHPKDLTMMLDDNPYGVHFSLDKFFASIGAPVFLHEENFATNIHATLLRTHLADPETVKAFGATLAAASDHYLHEHAIVSKGSPAKQIKGLSGFMDRFSAGVSARCMVGADAYAHPELTDLFLEFNTVVDQVMQMSSVLPVFLQFIPKLKINKSYDKFRKILLPIIKKRREDPHAGQEGLLDFMPFVLDVIEDDDRASDLVALSVWLGLRNLQISATSTLLDIINKPGLAEEIMNSLQGATVAELDTFSRGGTKGSPWALLRSAALESIRLCGTITGPARVVTAKTPLALRSDPSVHLPPGQVATLSTYYTHRQRANFGPDAPVYRADRFVDCDPGIGSIHNISFGLQGPRICPGQWYVQEAICIMVKKLLERYTFSPAIASQSDSDKYIYHAGVVTRNEVSIVVVSKPYEEK